MLLRNEVRFNVQNRERLSNNAQEVQHLLLFPASNLQPAANRESEVRKVACGEILPRNEGGNGAPARRQIPFQKAAHSLKRDDAPSH